MAKSLNEDYTKYIESSDMIMEYYKNQQTTGLEKYFLDIENWLAKDIPEEQNKPLVIQAEEGVGKKTLLVKWIEYHQNNSKKAFKDLILAHFAGTGGNNSNYYYAIYKILIKLREAFNISQKVELVEEKLRKYFHYWLDVCSRTIKDQVVNDSQIILVLEGIDQFMDIESTSISSNSASGANGNDGSAINLPEETQISMWLPKLFPDRVRVIVTASPKSQAMETFRKYECEAIPIISERPVIENVINMHINRPLYIIDDIYKERIIKILNEHFKQENIPSLFIKTYLSCLLPYPSVNIIKDTDINKEEFKNIFEKIDFNALEGLKSMQELFTYLIDHFSKVITTEEKFIDTMSILTLTQKGLTAHEILTISGITIKEWHYLVAIFKTFFMKFKGYWKINNEIFRDVLTRKYLHDMKRSKALHEKIAEMLEKAPNSIRKLEEQTYHLYAGKNFFKLKEAVSNIENFLLLFNPNNKYDLCRYWQILQEKGFDPSMEYTKQIESFEMHYRPSADDMFRIMIQISRFLKEFSDFETEYTPSFRHPPIKGGKELTEIGIRKEIKKMEMFIVQEIGSNEEDLDEMEELAFELHNDLKGSKLLDSAKDIVKEIHMTLKAKKQADQQQQQQQPQQELANSMVGMSPALTNGSSMKKLLVPLNGKLSPIVNKKLIPHGKVSKDPPILDSIECLNVDIPENRLKVREYYLKQIDNNDDANKAEEAIPNKIGLVYKEDMENIENQAKVVDEDDVNNKSNSNQHFIPTSLVLSSSKQSEDHDQMNNKIPKIKQVEEKPPVYYYYKRWLWMMFPWACLAYKANFSQIIFECFSSPTRYMSVSEERKFTQEALRITIEAKLKKKAMYAKNDDMSKKGDDDNKSLMLDDEVGSNASSSRVIVVKKMSKSQSQHTLTVNNANENKSPRKESVVDLKKALKNQSEIIRISPTIEQKSPGLPNANTNTNLHTLSGTVLSPKKNEPKQFFITAEFLSFNTLNSSANLDQYRHHQQQQHQQQQQQHQLTMTQTQPITSPIIVERKESELFNESSINPLTKSISKSKIMKSDKIYEKMIKQPSYGEATTMLDKFQRNMQEQNECELFNFEQKVIKLQRELNDLVYKNKVLARKLKEVTVSGHSLNSAIGTESIDSAKSKILILGQKIDKMKRNLTESYNEQDRLKKIIFVCQKNKKQNEPWIRELNFLLQNLKKMIKWENELKAKTEIQIAELKKLLEAYVKACNEKFKNHQNLLDQLKSRMASKDTTSHKIEELDHQLELTAMEEMDKLNKAYKNPSHIKDQKNKMLQIEKNAKATQDRLDHLTELYEKVKSIIGDDKDEDYEKSEEFQKFLQNITRKNDLERIVFEKRESMKDIEEKILEKKKFLEVLKKAQSGKKLKEVEKSDAKDDKDYDKTYFEEVLRTKTVENEHSTWTVKKNTQALLDIQLMIQKITGALKLGPALGLSAGATGTGHSVEKFYEVNLPVEEIMNKHDQMLASIKEKVDEQTYQKFMKREYDFAGCFTMLTNDQPTTKLPITQSITENVKPLTESSPPNLVKEGTEGMN